MCAWVDFSLWCHANTLLDACTPPQYGVTGPISLNEPTHLDLKETEALDKVRALRCSSSYLLGATRLSSILFPLGFVFFLFMFLLMNLFRSFTSLSCIPQEKRNKNENPFWHVWMFSWRNGWETFPKLGCVMIFNFEFSPVEVATRLSENLLQSTFWERQWQVLFLSNLVLSLSSSLPLKHLISSLGAAIICGPSAVFSVSF